MSESEPIREVKSRIVKDNHYEDAIGLFDLQGIIEALAEEWQVAGKWDPPNGKDCISFMVTEAAEALDETLRAFNPNYVRNNPRGGSVEEILARADEEVADTIIMGLRWFNLRNKSALGPIVDKLRKMDQKKKSRDGEKK
jgi:hypothetical protein